MQMPGPSLCKHPQVCQVELISGVRDASMCEIARHGGCCIGSLHVLSLGGTASALCPALDGASVALLISKTSNVNL